MSTTPTANPIPSESPRDVKYNAGKFDEIINSPDDAYRDRFGKARLTWAGVEAMAKAALTNYGYITEESFESGFTLTVPNQVLLYEANGQYYRWTGSFPKVVAPGSVPDAGWRAVGDAALRSDLASSATALGDALIGVKLPYTGAIATTQDEVNKQLTSVLMYGADPTGLSDSTSAFQKCLDAENYIKIPAGNYLISGNLTKSGAPIRLIGDGAGVVNITCSATSGSWLKFSPTSGDHFFEMSGFTITCTALASAGVQLIWIDGSSQVTTATYRGMRVTGEREKRRGIVHNISFRSLDETHGFSRGLRITSLLNFTVHSLEFTGAFTSFADEGISIDGDGVPVDIRAFDLYTYNCKIALNMPDYVEGLYLSQFEFINSVVGINNSFQGGRSVILDSTISERSNALKIGPGHIAFTSSVGALFQGCAYLNISGMMTLSIATDVSSQRAHIYLKGQCNFVNVRDMLFINGASTATANAAFGLVGEVITNSTLHDNQATGLLECIHLLDGSVDNNIHNNKAVYNGLATGVVIVGTNSVANNISNNKGDLLPCAVESADNQLAVRSYVKSVNVTLAAANAGQSQLIGITIPNRIFRQAPEVAIAQTTGGAFILMEYVPTSSTATNLVFRAISANLGATSAGTYAVSIHAASNFG